MSHNSCRKKEKFEDSKGVIRRIYNTMAKWSIKHNGRQNSTQKANDWATQTPIKTTGMASGASLE